ncbi:CCZ1/INTU/HSP4 first Longin domain-containing protein [Entamoeba marina]
MFSSSVHLCKTIPETLIAQIGALNTRQESTYFLETTSFSILYHFIPTADDDLTYVLVSPSKETRNELSWLLNLSKSLTLINGCTESNNRSINTRRNIIENLFQIYDNTSLYLRVPPLIATLPQIINNYLFPASFSEEIKQLDGFGIVVDGFFRSLLPGKQLRKENLFMLSIWSYTLVKSFLADTEIKEDEYISGEFNPANNIVTNGLTSSPVSTNDCSLPFVADVAEFRITAEKDWHLMVQKITNDMLVVGYSTKGEVVKTEFISCIESIHSLLMLFRKELTSFNMSMTHPFNYRTAYPGIVHVVIIDHIKEQAMYPSFDPPTLGILMKSFIIECRDLKEYSTYYSRNKDYVFAYEAIISDRKDKERNVDYEVYGIFVRQMPFKLMSTYLTQVLAKYKEFYTK